MNENERVAVGGLRPVPAATPGSAPAADRDGRTWWSAAALAQRIAAGLRARADIGGDPAWARVLAGLERRHPSTGSGIPPALARLDRRLKLGEDGRTLLVLAAMADGHESHAAAFAALHPRGEPRPTWGLFTWLLAAEAAATGDVVVDDDDPSRSVPLRLLHASPLTELGLVRLAPGDTPLPQRNLQTAEALWPALHGLPAWPSGSEPMALPPGAAGIDDWLTRPEASTALALLESAGRDGAGPAPTVLLRGENPAALRLRAQQLTDALGGLAFEWDVSREPAQLSALLAHALLRGALPVLLCAAPLPPAQAALVARWPAALVLAGTGVAQAARWPRALAVLDAAPPSAAAQAGLWSRLLPELDGVASALAARHAVGPETLAQLRADLAPWLARGAEPPLACCAAVLKTRLTRADDGFARRVQPAAGWDDLVLPADKLAPLKAGVARMQGQRRVLDEWGFARGAEGTVRAGARGLRLLFAGLPGTGKTLAAEVVARALHADLLVIDLARLVSKWIGETEKNLAAAFEQAEGSGAVLFFDEADALFGKRTEVADAHDRYANIESAYLLSRLERHEGVAVLATNLRGNLDRAFLRRFEVVIDFPEPGPAERAAIWRRQFPPAAPLAADVDLALLAAQHALPGALIRNAALTAAYLAAAEGGPITRAALACALRQEYDKSGRACPA